MEVEQVTPSGRPALPLVRGLLPFPSAGRRSGKTHSPRTLFRGSLMLTVWSWEAERELFMERSAVKREREGRVLRQL